MKENQPEILRANGVEEEDLSTGKKGAFGSNGIVSECCDHIDALSDHSFASIDKKLHVSPPQDDDEKEPFHVTAQKPDEEVTLVLLLASDEKPTPLDGNDTSVVVVHCEEDNKRHNPITDLCVDEAAGTGKEHFGDELIDQKPREDETKANRSILSLQDHFAHGEASFSALGLAGASHPAASVPYSGSTSLRSDSSTTSATSFAFPVLQPEWISSPVRMKKSYNRFWKHGRWCRRLLCCRF